MSDDIRLHLSEDFCAACKMFQIQSVEALQFYVSKTTIYHHLTRSDDMALLLAARIFDQYLESIGGVQGMLNEFARITSIKYIKKVLKLIASRSKFDEREKKYKNLICEWYATLESSLPSKSIKTEECTVLLTKDFSILCNIFTCVPVKVLQYYIDHVSFQAYLNTATEYTLECATNFFLQYPPILKQIDAN